MATDVKHKITGLLERISSKVKEVRPKCPIEITPAYAYIMGMYWRSVSIFDAIVVLLEKEFIGEALMLARSLFVESLRLAELASVKEDKQRIALVLGWANYSIEQKKKLIRDAARTKLEDNPAELLDNFAQEQQRLQDYQRRHGVGTPKKFLSEGDAALKFGRRDDYWTYAFSHQMVHGGDAAYIFRRQKLKNDIVGIFSRTSDITVFGGAAFFAARSVLQAAQSTIDIFKWHDDGGLKVLLNEVNEFPEPTPLKRSS